MPESLIELLPVLFQVGMLSALLALSARLVRDSGRSLTAVFLAFLLALWLLTDLYWVIYDLQRPGTRMPFAANEIGEAAVFLLAAALLASAAGGWLGFGWPEAAVALAFAAGNVALWIGWSGEWVEDVFIGAAFAWYVYAVVRALASTGALGPGDWWALGVGCAALLIGQGLTFFVPESARTALDAACALLMAAAIVWWIVKIAAARRRHAPADALLALAFGLICWITAAKYMSDGVRYTLLLVAETLCLPLLYGAARRVVAEA